LLLPDTPGNPNARPRIHAPMKPILIFILLATTLTALLTTPLSARAQPILTLKGAIRDAATKEPIPYATLSLAANGISTLTNEEGQFIFKIPPENQTDSIFITHIGYHPIAILPTPDAQLLLDLYREPAQLPGITVRPPDAWNLIEQAITRIPDNYPTRPFVLTGFYRTTSGYPHPKKIVDISEALFTIYSPDNQRSNMQFRLIRARNEKDLTAYNGRPYSLGSKPDDIMDRDMISRIHQTQILGDEGHNDHQFTYGGLIDYEGRPAYEIRFDEKDGIPRPLYKGRILIDTTTLAFLCFDYQVSPKGIPYLPHNSSGPGHNNPTGSNILIQYKRYGGKYYLHHIYIQQGIHSFLEGKKPIDYDTVRIRRNFIITRIDTGLVAFSRVGTKLDNQRIIENQIKENRAAKEDNYWENYNLIEADYNVDSAIAVIRANNARPKK
jgi:hypothetical protein